MFPLSSDVALLFARQRLADDHRRAERHRLQASAAPPRGGRRGLFRGRPFRTTPHPRHARIRIADADPSQYDAMLAFLRNLSPHTSYSRFIRSTPAVEHVDIQNMLAADPRHSAVVALCGKQIVGHAQAVASADRDAVEFGVVIADEWQGNGLGRRLVRALLETGPAAVGDELEFFVLNGNGPARRLVKELWPEAVASRDGELIHYVVHSRAGSDSTAARGAATPVGCPE